jgi:hypothetical protein
MRLRSAWQFDPSPSGAVTSPFDVTTYPWLSIILSARSVRQAPSTVDAERYRKEDAGSNDVRN